MRRWLGWLLLLAVAGSVLIGSPGRGGSDSSRKAPVGQARLGHQAKMRRPIVKEAEESAPEESGCDPNYSGACLNPAESDYDCAGGSGNGPGYTGTVEVIGEDHYGLDADGDGVGCEDG